MSLDLAMMSAAMLAANFRAGKASPVEATRAALDRIAALDPTLNAYVEVFTADALRDAAASEARWLRHEPLGPLDGVPTSIKDLTLVKGHPTLYGSRTTRKDQAWTDDSPAAGSLRRSGAVLIGKTTTPEFGWKGVTDSPLSGITRNPWDPTKTPGGSSGGAAVAVATGMATLAVGGDGGGSVRIPAAFTGVFGLKPTAGRIPYYPPSPHGALTHVGVLARTVRDASLMFSVLVRPDQRDPRSFPSVDDVHAPQLEEGARNLRIAFSPDLGYARVDREVAATVKTAVDLYASLGSRVDDVGTVFADPRAAFETLFWVGQAKRYRALSDAQRALVEPGFAEVAREGLAVELARYVDAESLRIDLAIQFSRFLGDYDVLITPQLPITAFDAGLEVPAGSGMRRWTEWTPFTYPFNLTGHPAATVPCGFDSKGLPIAFQIVGHRHADALVLRAARAYESVRPFKMPKVG